MNRRPAKPHQFRFTKATIEAVPPPKSGLLTVHDLGQANLILLVTPNGAKTFYRYGRINGRPARVKIGRWPDITVEQARKACKSLSGKVADGIDPEAARKAARASQTLQEAFDAYMAQHVRPKRKERTCGEYARQFDAYLTKWRTRRLSEVTKDAVRTLHAKIGRDHGRTTANRVLALLRAVLNFADIAPNPAARIEKFREESRDRFLSADELGRLWTALDHERTDSTLRDYVKLSLWTGARQWNVCSAEWADFDLEAGIWKLRETKSGKPQNVYLCPEAVAMLRERKATTTSDYVFPGRYGKGHMYRPYKAWERLIERAGIENLRPHDLRRTLGSWQAAAGVSLHIVGKTLGHSTPQATQVYAQLELEPIKQAVDLATAAMRQAVGGKGADDGQA